MGKPSDNERMHLCILEHETAPAAEKTGIFHQNVDPE
jgi:hypothetical protein